MLGSSEGISEGASSIDGSRLRSSEGETLPLGAPVGSKLGRIESMIGPAEGLSDGKALWSNDGAALGLRVSFNPVGPRLGMVLGSCDGSSLPVGISLGRREGTMLVEGVELGAAGPSDGFRVDGRKVATGAGEGALETLGLELGEIVKKTGGDVPIGSAEDGNIEPVGLVDGCSRDKLGALVTSGVGSPDPVGLVEGSRDKLGALVTSGVGSPDPVGLVEGS
jgi:hypothetical protein